MTTSKKTVVSEETESTKTCLYQSLLSKSNETKNQELVLEKVEEARIQIQHDILQAKKAVSLAKAVLDRAKSDLNFNSSVILAAKYNLENAEVDYNNLIALQAELF
jgi:hypothetical protein